MKKYQIIYADPPWSYKVWSENKKLAQGCAKAHYNTMSIKDICALPISEIADKDCKLFLWATPPCLKEAIATMEAWGFEYKTVAFTWVKTNKNSMGLFMGMGRWTRSNAEICLLGTKGFPKRIDASVHQVIMSPVMGHSRKPSIIREKIVQLMGDLPRIELFARQKVEGWYWWGNEVESDIELLPGSN